MWVPGLCIKSAADLKIRLNISGIIQRPEHGEDVFNRHITDDIMNSIKNKTSSRTENINILPHFAVNLIGRTKWQCFLSVHAPSPEYNIFCRIRFSAPEDPCLLQKSAQD